MGCACFDSRGKEDLPQLQNAPRVDNSSQSVPSESPSLSTVSSRSTLRRQNLTAGYSVLSPYRLGRRKGLVIGELKSTKKRCVVHVLPLREGMLKTASCRNALKESFTQLDHPHVRLFYGVMRDATSLHMAFETCEGGELANLLEDKQSFSEQQAGMVIKQVLGVLKYLHQRDMCHGNLHPEFIGFISFSERDVTIKVSGLFAQFWDNSRPLTVYDAPECSEQAADAKSDIWSCGMLLYRLLAGKLPFTKHSDMRTPLLEAGAYSPEAVSLTREMLTLDPNSRPLASVLLTHPWLLRWTAADLTSTELRKGIIRLQELPSAHPLRQTLMMFVLDNVLDQEEVAQMGKVFTFIDTDQNGVLCREELLSALRLAMSEDKALSVTRRLLASRDTLDYSTFLLCVFTSDILSNWALTKAFRMLCNGSERQLVAETLQEITTKQQRRRMSEAEGEKLSFAAFQKFMRLTE